MGANGTWVAEIHHSLEANFITEEQDTLSLLVAYNGLGLFVPVINYHWAEALKVQYLFSTGLSTTTNFDICEMLPESAVKDRLVKLIPVLKAGISYVQSIKFVDGSADHIPMDSVLDPVADPIVLPPLPAMPGTSGEVVTPRKRKRVVDPDEGTSVEGGETRGEAEKRCKRNDLQCFCGKGCSSQGNLDSHIDKVHKDSKWHCHTCKKLYTAKGALWKHYRTVHLGQYIYMCHICKIYGSDEKANVLRHFIGEHPNSQEAIDAKSSVPTCVKCNQPFSSLSSLRKHEKICGKKVTEKPFVCEEQDCLQGFRNAQSLRRHLEIAHPEPGENPADCMYKCPYCPLKFVYKHSLDKHVIDFHHKPAPKPVKVVTFPEYRR